MSMLYLLSSDATKAVRLGGLSVSLVGLASSKVLTFHAANFIVGVCLLLVFRLLSCDALVGAVTHHREIGSGQFFGHLF